MSKLIYQNATFTLLKLVAVCNLSIYWQSVHSVTAHPLFLIFFVITSRCSIIDLCLSVGSRREDDWTCPSCGNVNFSFRTTCNMRNCTQPRPADHNSVICGLLYYLYLEKQNHFCFCYFLCRNSQSANILVCWCE